MRHDKHEVTATALFLAALGCLATAGGSAAQETPSFNPDDLMADVRTYHEFGVHRTAHAGDLQTSAWLAQRLRAAGLETSEHAFSIRQFFLEEASVDVGDGRIPAFPIWLPRGTPEEGVTARLVVVDEGTPTTEIERAIAWLRPERGAWSRDRLHEKAIAAGAAAILFETTDGAGVGTLRAINAERAYVDAERPVPTLIYGAGDTPRLERAIGREVTVRLTGLTVERAEAKNVYGERVVHPDAEWIVVSTPSSGWFESAGERGPGIAILLALADWVGKRFNGLNYMFLATSGHELDYLGARLFHEAHLAPPAERTRAWLHLGAQIATPPWREVDGALVPGSTVTTGTLQATEGLAPALQEAFAHLGAYTLRTGTRIGEFRDLVEHGYQGLGIVGGSNPWFHVPGDPPSSVSPETLAAVAAAAAQALIAVERLPASTRE